MCPTKVSNEKGKRYTDKLGRSLYTLVLAVKESDPVECLANSRPDIKFVEFAYFLNSRIIYSIIYSKFFSNYYIIIYQINKEI